MNRVWLAGLLVVLSASHPLDVKVSPRVAIGVTTVVLTIRIWPNPANRRLDASLTSDDGDSHTSSRQLDGDQAAITYRFEFKSVGPGHYDAQACVWRQDGKRSCSAGFYVEISDH